MHSAYAILYSGEDVVYVFCTDAAVVDMTRIAEMTIAIIRFIVPSLLYDYNCIFYILSNRLCYIMYP